MTSPIVSEQAAGLDSVKDPQAYWEYRYTTGNTQWHLDSVSPLLLIHYTKLNPDGRANKVFFPMCGMSVDIDWLADEKDLQVVGIDISVGAIQKVMIRSGHEWTESLAPKLGHGARVFKRQDGKVKLYVGDVFQFSPEIEGKFDAICDRHALHVVEPENRERLVEVYSEMYKRLLNTDGRILLEAINYEPKILEKSDKPMVMEVPPPYAMRPDVMKALFEPECTVEHVGRLELKLLYGNDTDFNSYLIVKQ